MKPVSGTARKFQKSCMLAHSPTYESRIDIPIVPAVALAQAQNISPLFNDRFTRFLTQLITGEDDTPRTSADARAWQPDGEFLRQPSPPPYMAPFELEIGNDSGHWLLIPRLKNKRLDVMLLPRTSGSKSMSGPHRNAIEQKRAGYIVIKEALKEEDLDKKMVVKVDGEGKVARVEPRFFAPCRTTFCPPACWVHESIANKSGRVVIIGPDSLGKNDALGKYGWTFPQKGTVGHSETVGLVIVQLRKKGGTGEVKPARTFPVESLCRSKNVAVDGAEATDVGQYS
jgi:hypothetical protein